jgi:hypothetical protein
MRVVDIREAVPMAQYVHLGAVRTWYDEHGDGDRLVLLPGGLVDARFFAPDLGPPAERFHVYTPNVAVTATPPTSGGRSPTS